MPTRVACVDDYDSLWAWRSVDDIAVEKGEVRNEGPGWSGRLDSLLQFADDAFAYADAYEDFG